MSDKLFYPKTEGHPKSNFINSINEMITNGVVDGINRPDPEKFTDELMQGIVNKIDAKFKNTLFNKENYKLPVHVVLEKTLIESVPLIVELAKKIQKD